MYSRPKLQFRFRSKREKFVEHAWEVVLRDTWNWSDDNDTVAGIANSDTQYYRDTGNTHSEIEFTSLRLADCSMSLESCVCDYVRMYYDTQ